MIFFFENAQKNGRFSHLIKKKEEEYDLTHRSSLGVLSGASAAHRVDICGTSRGYGHASFAVFSSAR